MVPAQEVAAGHAPANVAAPVVGQTASGGAIRKVLSPAQLKFGVKQRSAAAQTGPAIRLPQPELHIQQVEGEPYLEYTIKLFGVPTIVEEQAKDSKGNLLDRITKKLKMATTRSAFAVMTEVDDGAGNIARERLEISVPWTDPETNEESELTFAVSAISHVFGTLESDVELKRAERAKERAKTAAAGQKR